MKVAIVHDWLVGGGAERVVLELHRMFPEAPIYTSYATKEWREKLDGKVITGYLQLWPFSVLRKFIPLLRVWWFRSLHLDEYDVIISSKGNGEANHVKKREDAKHICYCHSPTHFYWRKYKAYLEQPGFGFFNPLARFGLKMLVKPLRQMDYQAAQNVDYFIANSTHIQNEIKNVYKRDSFVIHPPVDIERFKNVTTPKRHGFVTVGRQVPYKRTELIVQACSGLNLPLTVIGSGPEHDKLTRIAGKNITFISNATDEQVAQSMATAEAFIFAAEEDFGIVAVEAMAAGTPVIAYKAGGALDYVIADETGTFFAEQTVESLAATLTSFKPDNFQTDNISHHAQSFSTAAFRKKFTDYLETLS